MSHELSFREDGTAEMVYQKLGVGDTPWHGYGTPIPLGLTWPEAIKLAGLDWPVGKVPVQFMDEGFTYTFPDRFVTFRGDNRKGLGIVGSDYEVIGNARSFEAAVQVAKIKGAKVVTMGALHGGRVVWCLLGLPGTFNVNGDRHLRYLLVYTSHDGSSKVRVKVTAVRVVCKNTADCALYGSGRELAFAHTSDFDAEVKRAEGMLEAADDIYETYRKVAEGLVETYVPPAVADKAISTFAGRAMWSGTTREELERALVEEAIGPAIGEAAIATYEATVRKRARYTKAVDLIHARLDEEKDNHGGDLTAWILENSMSGWVDHERSSAKGERRFSSLIMGEGARLKAVAHEVVVEAIAKAA